MQANSNQCFNPGWWWSHELCSLCRKEDNFETFVIIFCFDKPAIQPMFIAKGQWKRMGCFVLYNVNVNRRTRQPTHYVLTCVKCQLTVKSDSFAQPVAEIWQGCANFHILESSHFVIYRTIFGWVRIRFGIMNLLANSESSKPLKITKVFWDHRLILN